MWKEHFNFFFQIFLNMAVLRPALSALVLSGVLHFYLFIYFIKWKMYINWKCRVFVPSPRLISLHINYESGNKRTNLLNILQKDSFTQHWSQCHCFTVNERFLNCGCFDISFWQIPLLCREIFYICLIQPVLFPTTLNSFFSKFLLYALFQNTKAFF